MSPNLYLTCVMMLIVFESCIGQTSRKNTSNEIIQLDSTNSCAYLYTAKSFSLSSETFVEADSAVLAQVEILYKAAGFSWNKSQQYVFVTKNRGIDNCLAYPVPYNKNNPQLGFVRYISYNPQFLESAAAQTGSPYAVVSVLAHELAHHLYGHSFTYAMQRQQAELQADYFSGFMMGRIADSSLTLPIATNTLSIFAGNIESSTHPNKAKRIQSFTEGWEYAKLIDSLSCESRNLLVTDPEKFIERVKTENPEFYQKMIQKIRAQQYEAHLQEYAKLSTEQQLTSAFVMAKDENYYLSNVKDKLVALDSTLKKIASPSMKVITSAGAGSFTANLDFKSNNAQYENVLYLDKDNVIWDRLPNGVPYIVGYKQKIK